MLENYRNYSRNFRSLVEVIYCSSLQSPLPADASVHFCTHSMYCTFWLERRRKSATYALMHSYSATEVPWCVFIRSSGCITLLFQLKRLLNKTSVAYRPTDKSYDKRRSWMASKVLEANGLYKHYIQWQFWRDEKYTNTVGTDGDTARFEQG